MPKILVDFDDSQNHIIQLFSDLNHLNKSQSVAKIISLFGESFLDDMLMEVKLKANGNPKQ